MRQLLFFILLTFLFSSCKKDKDEASNIPPPPPPTPINPNDCYSIFSGRIGTPDNSTLILSDNSLIICGNAITNYENSGIIILKVSKKGETIWRKDYPSSVNSAAGIAVANNHEIFICGQSSSDALVMKVNSYGDTIWTKTYGGTQLDLAHNIIPTSDGNLLIGGVTKSFGADSLGDIYLIKIDTNGDTLWTRYYPDPNQGSPHQIIETNDGGYLVTGERNKTGGAYFIKVNSSGDQLWNNQFVPMAGYMMSTIQLPNGDFISAGQVGGTPHILLARLDNLGSLIWYKWFNDSLEWRPCSIKPNGDGTFSIAAAVFGFVPPTDNIGLLKMDENGNKIWSKTLAGYRSAGFNLIKDINDDNIITGPAYTNYEEFFMVRTDKDGNLKLPE